MFDRTESFAELIDAIEDSDFRPKPGDLDRASQRRPPRSGNRVTDRARRRAALQCKKIRDTMAARVRAKQKRK